MDRTNGNRIQDGCRVRVVREFDESSAAPAPEHEPRPEIWIG